MLKYLKYAENLKNKKFGEAFGPGDEQKLMIRETGKDFEAFAGRTLRELDDLAKEIMETEMSGKDRPENAKAKRGTA